MRIMIDKKRDSLILKNITYSSILLFKKQTE